MGKNSTSISRRSLVCASAVAAVAAVGTQALPVSDAQAVEAPATPTWLGEPPAIDDADCSEVLDTEVLVVGAGTAGYFAAGTAAEEGAKTILIDCSEMGFGIRGSALGAVNSKLQLANGAVINKAEIVNDVVRYANGTCDQRLWAMWAEESGETLDWYCSHVEKGGIARVEQEWNMPEGTSYPTWPTGHGTVAEDYPFFEGEAVMSRYFNEYIPSFEGCLYRPFTKLVKLITENNAVVGAYCSTGEDESGLIRINASKGVVIATGGYVLNREMMEALQPDVVSTMVCAFTMCKAYGDGIKACLWAGAQMEGNHTSMIFDRGLIEPFQQVGDPYGSPIPVDNYNFSSQPWLKVNVDGERFMNESAPYDYVAHAAVHNRDHAWYPIWDDNFADDVALFHTVGCSTQIKREGGDQQMSGDKQAVRDGVAERVERGLVQKADTIEELAEKLGINAERLVATVERYNELCRNNKDVDFGKEAWRLRPVEQPPFYGMKIGGINLCTLDGICVNPDLQALDTSNNPIERLYVIGNDAGGVYNTTYPNFAAGINAGRCATQGRHVGKLLAKR